MLVEPGTTNGAHTLRLLSSVEQLLLLCASAIWVSAVAINSTSTSAACWKQLKELIADLKAPMATATLPFL